MNFRLDKSLTVLLSSCFLRQLCFDAVFLTFILSWASHWCPVVVYPIYSSSKLQNWLCWRCAMKNVPPYVCLTCTNSWLVKVEPGSLKILLIIIHTFIAEVDLQGVNVNPFVWPSLKPNAASDRDFTFDSIPLFCQNWFRDLSLSVMLISIFLIAATTTTLIMMTSLRPSGVCDIVKIISTHVHSKTTIFDILVYIKDSAGSEANLPTPSWSTSQCGEIGRNVVEGAPCNIASRIHVGGYHQQCGTTEQFSCASLNS